MGLIKAFSGALKSTFGDQWKDIITDSGFDNHTLISPGIRKTQDNGRGSEFKGSSGVITKGSKIFVPENVACFIFSQSGIEQVVTEPGGYEYNEGQDSIFSGGGLKSIFSQIGERTQYGGISSEQKTVAFINLREITDIKFGTRGPQLYNDLYYGCDFEIYSYGTFTIKVIDANKFVREFVPPMVTSLSVEEEQTRNQLTSEFLQSFIVAINSLSGRFRLSQLASQANSISQAISNDSQNAGTWEQRFGIKLVKVSIENIEFSDESRELVNEFNKNKMGMRAYEGVSQQASNIKAQQNISQGIANHGFGDVGGMFLGVGAASNINPFTGQFANQPPQNNYAHQNINYSEKKVLWICPKCHHENGEEKFCPNCGEKKPVELNWSCPSCGTNNIHSKFCPNCGYNHQELEQTWTCPSCGMKEIESKFCPNCGTKKI